MNKQESKSKYLVGSRWILFFGNGMKTDTIVKNIDNFRVKLASGEIVQKSWLGKYWYNLNNGIF